MITDEFINSVLAYEGLLGADINEYSSKAGGYHRGWKDLGRAFSEISGWEATKLDDGFPILAPKGADLETSSYIYVNVNEYNVPRFTVNVVTEIDAEWGEPFYSTYDCTYAPDLMPLLIAFGV